MYFKNKAKRKILLNHSFEKKNIIIIIMFTIDKYTYV